jgi:lactate permease
MQDFLPFLLACAPILWLFFSLSILRVPGPIACLSALAVSVLSAIGAWKMTLLETGSAVLEGVLFALWPIVLVIFSALILYKYSVYTGGMAVIKKILAGVSFDRRVLVLIIAWGFGGFLEGVAGFGTPVIIPGGILIALGFSPLFSVIACLIANSAPTAFATIGIPLRTLADITAMDEKTLGFVTALQLAPLCMIVPFLLVAATGRSPRAIKGVFWTTFFSGAFFLLPILLLSKFAGPELPTLIGSVCSVAATVASNKIFYKNTERDRAFRIQSAEESSDKAPGTETAAVSLSEAVHACLPFGVVFLTVFITSDLIPPIHNPLSTLRTAARIYSGQGGAELTFSWVLTPGILILIAVLISCLIQKQSFAALAAIIKNAAVQSKNLTITVMSIVAMAKVMNYSGMTNDIALVLISVFGAAYPLIAPVIGAMGTFITGSDTTCCILFGQLQLKAAVAIGADPFWIVASNLSGATAGKMISPQSIAVAVATADLAGKDGEIFRGTLKYCAMYLLILCLYVFFMQYI